MITAGMSVYHEPISASRYSVDVAAGKEKSGNHPDLESARRRCVPQFPRKVRESHQTGEIPDLTALKSVFAWAVNNRRISSNPATGVTIDLGKPVKLRSKSFTDDEAKALLQAASARTRGNERQKTFDAVRWAPWVMAYSGYCVGEFAQLRKQDVSKKGEYWVAHMTPEAGTVKDKEARDLVLHPHLVELGFPAFVMAAKPGHLFLDPAKDGDVLGPLQGVVNRITEAARKVVQTDESPRTTRGDIASALSAAQFRLTVPFPLPSPIMSTTRLGTAMVK